MTSQFLIDNCWHSRRQGNQFVEGELQMHGHPPNNIKAYSLHWPFFSSDLTKRWPEFSPKTTLSLQIADLNTKHEGLNPFHLKICRLSIAFQQECSLNQKHSIGCSKYQQQIWAPDVLLTELNYWNSQLLKCQIPAVLLLPDSRWPL